MLTKKQKDFLDGLKEVVRKRGYFPTVREIGKELGLSSPATVHSYLNRLFEKGYLKKKGNKGLGTGFGFSGGAAGGNRARGRPPGSV
jgi:SOS-response transcriptional repressor LexA